jgi:hypothetical protein
VSWREFLKSEDERGALAGAVGIAGHAFRTGIAAAASAAAATPTAASATGGYCQAQHKASRSEKMFGAWFVQTR